MKSRKTLFEIILILISSFYGCKNNEPKRPVESESTEHSISIEDKATDRIESFIEDFDDNYPEYKLLDYVAGTDENSPIQLAAIAEEEENGRSSTLFIVDGSGIGQVVLASDSFATYREEEGMILDKNTISLSLDLKKSDIDFEVHDFLITVTQDNVDGKPNTVYSSKEIIRE